jgi:hypothetical protein
LAVFVFVFAPERADFRADFAFEAAGRRFGAADRAFPVLVWLVRFLAFALRAGFLAMMGGPFRLDRTSVSDG